ncbi:hypothetical protein EGT07_21745 [Herbaspirillum sp. HC18]|nr:hypothetical protein EGT07_21745 [Herbaspirillum sp. HC18]
MNIIEPSGKTNVFEIICEGVEDAAARGAILFPIGTIHRSATTYPMSNIARPKITHRMTYVSHFRFQPDSDPPFEQLSLEDYQNARNHPGQPIKDRSWMDEPPSELTAYRMENVPVHSARDENIRRSLMNDRGSREFFLRPGDIVKMIGFNWYSGAPVATTGTSKINTLCLTDGLMTCIAVAIGGENFSCGSLSTGAKVRIFHVHPANTGSVPQLRSYIKRLKRAGLTVRAAMFGGMDRDVMSVTQAENLRSLLAELNVNVDFDETCEKRNDDTPLGVVILDDHSIRFVTKLAQLDETPR